MKKRLFVLISIFMLSILLSSCTGKGCDLLILNWGDYISDDLIADFESEYGVTVNVATVDSNEQMYMNIIDQFSEYDLVVPSDYMIDQMASDDMLIPLDFTKLENYEEGMFVDELEVLMNSSNCSSYKNYYIPYFWGSLAIMYNKEIEGVEEAVLEHGYKVLFEHDLLPKGAKVGMYNTSRDALAAAEIYYGYSLNTTDYAEINRCMDLLKNTNFAAWGTDELKIQVSNGNLDVALVYTGDYFDAYYADLEADLVDKTSEYGIYAPKMHNNVFFDGIGMPFTSTNQELAYKFIDFLLQYDYSYMNAEFVGYCPTLESVYNDIMNDEEGWGDVISIDAYDPAKIINTVDSRAEVYKYLGYDVYDYIETKFIEVIAA